MKTIEAAAKDFALERRFRSDGYPPTIWFKAGVEFAQQFIPVTEEKPEEHELVIAKYSEDCYAIARYEGGSFLTAYPVNAQPIEWRPLNYK